VNLNLNKNHHTAILFLLLLNIIIQFIENLSVSLKPLSSITGTRWNGLIFPNSSPRCSPWISNNSNCIISLSNEFVYQILHKAIFKCCVAYLRIAALYKNLVHTYITFYEFIPEKQIMIKQKSNITFKYSTVINII